MLEQARKIEPNQENLNFEEARGLPNPEKNFVSVNIWTLQNRDKTTKENWSTFQNNSNQSLLWDEIDLPVPTSQNQQISSQMVMKHFK